MSEKITAESIRLKSFEMKFTKQYIVPTLQRPYVWEAKKHVKKFIDDISENEEGYFIGSIVLIGSKSTVGRDEIIDGQQRLTTIALILIALRDLISFNKENDEIEIILKEIRNFLYGYDGYEKQEILRLKFNDKETDKFFIDMVNNSTNKKNVKTSTGTQKKILDNYQYIKSEFEKYFLVNNEIEKEILNIFWNKIKNLNAIGITCVDHTIAYELFESINATGLSLASIDLIKNFIFKQLKNDKDKLKQAENNWINMESIFADDRNLLKTFLRHQWISFGDYVSHSSLFDKVEKKYKDNENEIIKYTESILKDAEKYFSLRNSNIESLEKLTTLKQFERNEIKNVLRFLKFLKVDQVYISILYFYREKSGDEFRKFLNKLVAFQFLYKYIPGSPSAAERLYSKFADNNVDKNKNFQDLIKLVDKQSEIFKEKFLEKIKYIPGRTADLQFVLEQHLYSKTDSPKATKNPTIEHIIAQKSSNQNNKKIINQLGNLTIFERDENSRLPNNIEDKLAEYKNSKYPEHQEILENYDFIHNDEEAIKKRGEDMALKIYEIFMDILRTGKLK